MFNNLPKTVYEVMNWSWAQFEPYYTDLQNRTLTAENVDQWMSDWTVVGELLDEMESRMYVATTVDTNDAAAEAAFNNYLDNILPAYSSAQQALKEKLLASKLEPKGFEIPLLHMRTEAEMFREANVPLHAQTSKLSMEYDRIAGARTVQHNGEEITLTQAYAHMEGMERSQSETLWKQISGRYLQDREDLNDLWQQFLEIRQQIAANAGFANFRDYQWQAFKRFDYTPDNCATFHAAIEEVVVPAATRVYERLRQRMGVQAVRPWDVLYDVFPPAHPKLSPYKNIEDLETVGEAIFHKVDPKLGEYFSIMRREKLLDLDNRKGKAPGGYCTDFAVAGRPFIFMNAVGSQDDVSTLLHEAGHAFHAFEADNLPYIQQREYPAEFAEVASMSMELISGPYWAAKNGGYYNDEDVVQARRQHLEHMLLFWPYMAVVDAFQHWVYTHADDAMNPLNCDAKWGELWNRFIPGIDWNGLDDARMTGWHRKLHIFQIPFYYVDYGLAQLGAVQVWRNSLRDQARAVEQYRQGLALGGTATLPNLFAAAGARFGFDAPLLREAVDLIESTLSEMGVS